MQPNDTTRFWVKVDKRGPTECWEWTHCLDRNGYGRVSVNARCRLAHRIAYEMMVGPIPDGLVLDHICRNPRCVNPAHLEVVTQRENLRRGIGASALNATKTHCKHGHAYTESNTRIRPDGSRDCRVCRQRWNDESNARVNAARFESRK